MLILTLKKTDGLILKTFLALRPIQSHQIGFTISVRKFSSVRFFAPKTRNRGPQPV
ncbi:uncharacterized protein LACBIDRAFT_312587 [Laccaria bicolor S238N-H82]|uniref:Predicted protein n=1 Tax=Laccaria bicolor (strain S238N-H82 / ATCC MYA-4686) TaxID=486041 RepID=B0DWG8_LACBS|nr:uncharacterized protein LACBIDRAFT_312587 [Laccaria bicolor S238N-H82]EDR01086.1 predicted protein [Laccaria bicolor S238N-H82]|eukprot:XP_001888305.1 predicted protein [Laccaria bicolor S238N-H82]